MADLTLKIEPEYRALHRIADNLAPQLRRDFLQAIKELRNQVSMDRLLQILARGDPAELGAFWQSYDQELAGAVRPAIRETLLRAAEAARIRNNVSTSFDLTNPKALELIDTQTATLVQGVTEESKNAIREVIRQGFLGNADVPEMARRIRESIGLTQVYATAVENYRRGQIAAGVNDATAERRASRYATQLLNLRATNIARTETIRAANLGQQAIWEQARQEGLMGPDQRRIWIVTPDDRLCPICEAIPPANPDGVGLTEPFKSPDLGAVMNPPAHPSCLPGYTLVATRDRIAAQSERWYEGEMVVIRTASGKELTITPNHQILTGRLWVAAGALNEGDDLVGDNLFERVTPTDSDYELMPTRIEEIADALRPSVPMTTREVPLTAEDFHGDGKGSKVATIRTYRLLWNRSDAPRRKPIPHDSFIASHETFATAFAGQGGFAERFHAARGPTGRCMGGSNLPTALDARHLPPLQPFGLGLRPHFYASPTQGRIKRLPSDTDLLREAVNGRSSRIALEKVVEIRRAPFSGHVFNLETSVGWYIAQGIIVHNCRCATALELPE